MMHFKNYGWLFFLSLFFTSCCEITEEIYLTKKGSGQAKIIIDAKESAPLIAFFMTQAGQQIMPDMPPIPSMGELDSKAKILVEKLNNAKNGISNAQFALDFKTAKFEFSADFASLADWNKAINGLELEGMKMQTVVHYDYTPEESFFTRALASQTVEQLKLMQKNPSAQEVQLLTAFQNARYRFYLAYEKPIRGKSENPLYLKGEKEITMQIRMGDLFIEPQKIDFKIKL